MSFFADEAEYADKAIEHVARGRAEIRAFWKLYFDAASEGFEADRTACVVSEDGYAFAWNVRGRIDGAFGALQGTGQLIEIEGASMGEIADGKIVRNADYWNLASVLRQVEEQTAATA